MTKDKTLSLDHYVNLAYEIRELIKYWKNKTNKIQGTLISVHYNQIVAKSNRLSRLLLSKGSNSPSDCVCGAKFEYVDGKPCHVITYYVSMSTLEKTLEEIEKVINILKLIFPEGIFSTNDINNIINTKEKINQLAPIGKTVFIKIMFDCYYVRKFAIDEILPDSDTGDKLITIFKTNVGSKELLSRFGITIYSDRIIDDTTFLLSRSDYQTLVERAPYLISMEVKDLSQLVIDPTILLSTYDEHVATKLIPKPTDEPIVGVIDTPFNEKVYFHEWVQYINMLDSNIDLTDKDYVHGTGVSFIIVDGPKGNPNLEDNCGRFRIRHFGVATSGSFSSFSILKKIRRIVAENRDIKVWNLSLGSVLEIQENSISPEAAEIDKIQNEYDVIFVIAGTNKDGTYNSEKIGAPADSLNSIVVNSVNFSEKSASYTRKGPVLSFFIKPDVSYYGGDGVYPHEKIALCVDDKGALYKVGTSFATPWVTRKIAFLIYKMGLSREVAKAMLIDSSIAWKGRENINFSVGYGIVPKNIEDIIKTKDDEIRFVIMGKAEDYETYTYNLPVPQENDRFPFIARATLVYFPDCNRNQGVDYTSTELDIQFGRLNKKEKIKSINNNKQGDSDLFCLYEQDARSLFRKWDNVKYICENTKVKPRPRMKLLDSGLWGLKVTSKERLLTKDRSHLNFGIVITLKEINGKNRFKDFIQICQARGWIVHELSIENNINIYNKAEQDITFE